MALNKSITLDNGVVVTYHRVVAVDTVTNVQCTITVYSYVDQAARNREKEFNENPTEEKWQPIYITSNVYVTDYDEDFNVVAAYHYLKTLDEYAGATDIFDNEAQAQELSA